MTSGKYKRLSHKTCIFCGDSFQGHSKTLACAKPTCQDLMNERRLTQAREASQQQRRRQQVHVRRLHSVFQSVRLSRQPKHNRECLRCGKLCWPNYFYCIQCHSRVSSGINVTETFPDSPGEDEHGNNV